MFFRQHTAACAEGERTHLRASLLAKSLLLAITAVSYAHAEFEPLAQWRFQRCETNNRMDWRSGRFHRF